MSEPTCVNCSFWTRQEGENGNARGFCRRNPPQMFPIAIRDRFTGQASQGFQTQHVMTEANWWCGEHQPTTTTILEGAD